MTAFASRAGNLVPGDTNGGMYNGTEGEDVFVRDRSTGTIERVSVSRDGGNGDGPSTFPSLAADAPRHVAFVSAATNLVAGDTNAAGDIFVRDRQTGETVRVSVAGDGTQATGGSSKPSISADGRFVAFESDAENLVAGDTNANIDVFVHDRDADGDAIFDEAQPGATTTARVSVATDGTPSTGLFAFSVNAAISATGRYVAFQSRGVLVADDSNNRADVFLHDRQTSTTTRVSVPDGGGQASVSDPANFLQSGNTLAISGDGTQVAFESTADNLVAGDTNNQTDVFVRDLTASRTVRVSDGFSNTPSLSFDGRLVSFTRYTFPSQVTVRDRDADVDASFDESDAGATTTTVESVSSDATPGNQGSVKGAIAAGAGRLAFQSAATNLVAGDTNGVGDVFVHRLASPPGTQLLGISKAGDGRGTVTSSPAGIDCGSQCVADVATGSQVTLTASPAAGSSFAGFEGGGCSTAATTCTVTADAARYVVATFDLIRHVLTVVRAGDGRGTVTSAPAGIDCGADCTENYVQGSEVTLTAHVTPGSPGFTFAGFSGAGCGGAATTCTVTIDVAKTVTATFARARHALTVTKAGDGRGTVTSSPAGIDCGADCTEDYLEGTEVTLTASPAAAFAGFDGACSGTKPCTVTIDRARSVTATFEDTSSGIPAPASPAGSPGAVAPPAGAQPPAPTRRRAAKAPAKLQVMRSRVRRSARRVSVLALITRRASGRARVEYLAAGRRMRFDEPIRNGRIAFTHPITRSQANADGGILTISYPGDRDTRPQKVRLRAASRAPNLRASRPRLADGRLHARGTLTRRARGHVRVQIEYVVAATTRTVEFKAPIDNGRWSLNSALPQTVRNAIAKRTGTVHSYTLFTGYAPARIRGQMRSYQILGNR